MWEKVKSVILIAVCIFSFWLYKRHSEAFREARCAIQNLRIEMEIESWYLSYMAEHLATKGDVEAAVAVTKTRITTLMEQNDKVATCLGYSIINDITSLKNSGALLEKLQQKGAKSLEERPPQRQVLIPELK